MDVSRARPDDLTLASLQLFIVVVVIDTLFTKSSDDDESLVLMGWLIVVIVLDAIPAEVGPEMIMRELFDDITCVLVCSNYG